MNVQNLKSKVQVTNQQMATFPKKFPIPHTLLGFQFCSELHAHILQSYQLILEKKISILIVLEYHSEILVHSF